MTLALHVKHTFHFLALLSKLRKIVKFTRQMSDNTSFLEIVLFIVILTEFQKRVLI